MRISRARSVTRLFCLAVIFALLASSCSTGQHHPSQSDSKTMGSVEYQNSSAHFNFYCAKQDLQDISDLQNALDGNYSRILHDLDTELFFKVNVIIYPTVKDFDNGIGYPDAPSWIAGESNDNQIYMVSPSHNPYHDYEGMIKCAVHEFTHVATASLNHNLKSVPRWARDGLAYIEAGQITSDDKKTVTAKVRRWDIPTLAELSNDNDFADIDGYQFAPTVVQFIIDKYGWTKFLEFVKYPDQMTTIFAVSSQAFQADWEAYLKREY